MVDFGRPAGDMYKSVYDADDSGVVDEVEALPDHAADHQNAGDDEISVSGLSGELADVQPPKAHLLGSASHTADSLVNLNLKISDGDLDKTTDTRTPAAHKASHQDAGTDEISVAGLVGRINLIEIADHATHHFDKDDFTQDGSWREKDLASIVPAGTIAVFFHMDIQCNSAGSHVIIRKNSNSYSTTASLCYVPVANINFGFGGLAFVDTDRKIMYNISSSTWASCYFDILGYVI